MHAVRRGSGLFRLLSTQSPLFCFLASARILHRQSSPPTSQSSPDWLFWWRQLFQRVCLGEKAHWSIIQGERVWEQGEGKCRRGGKKKESSRVGIRIQPVQNRKIMQGKFPFTKCLHLLPLSFLSVVLFYTHPLTLLHFSLPLLSLHLPPPQASLFHCLQFRHSSWKSGSKLKDSFVPAACEESKEYWSKIFKNHTRN